MRESVGIFLLLLIACLPSPPAVERRFDGQAAFRHIQAQLAMGPRYPGSPGWEQVQRYIQDHVIREGWRFEVQPFVASGISGRNLIARTGHGPVILVGAHYDTRRRADRDPERPEDPVPGANDGASGVAVLLELARALDRPRLRYEVWLVFFDAEDQGELDGLPWIIGSTHFAAMLTTTPTAMILVDMVGDADPQFYYERHSDPVLRERLWRIAAELGYREWFIPEPRWALIDDHLPFLQRGIPAVDIIDFDYPAWHTTADTLDRVSPHTLEAVGRVLEHFLESRSP
ncbi:MAG: M28 family peptidase [Anaerolineae bacterium]|nr:M28 family peptidase [Anaerolineae bacterium]